MPSCDVRGVEIAFETHGDQKNGDPIVLVMGLGSSLVYWADELIGDLVGRGYFVICPDNRDVGLSKKFEEKGMPDIGAIMAARAAGEPAEGPYHVDDMADDIIGVLDHLTIDSAHIWGVSMGGMIVQSAAARHPDRVKTLISHMSSSGDPDLTPASPEVMATLLSAPEADDRETVLNYQLKTRNVFGSPAYPFGDERIRDYCGRAYDRCYYPEGTARQMAAVVASGSRVDQLKSITVPTLVIHGNDDPLVPVDGGIDTAKHVPGAKLELIDGYGHDLPLQLLPRFAQMVDEFIRAA
ncbi:MAG: alpha/beta hydrolase [Alphaproteobacteria bacterium]